MAQRTRRRRSSPSPPGRQPVIYGYTRVSTERQADSGLSLDAQRERIEEAQRRLARQHQATVGAIYADPGVSATRHALISRPQGGQLDARLLAGDHVVIAKLDRAFRSQRDCVVTCERWMQRGVSVHMLDISVDTDTATGQVLIGILSVIAQWEATRIGERNREAKAAMRARGLSSNGARRLGYHLRRGGRLRPHQQERQIAQRIRRLRRNGHSWPTIAARLDAAGVKRPGGQKHWTPQAVSRLHEALEAGWP